MLMHGGGNSLDLEYPQFLVAGGKLMILDIEGHPISTLHTSYTF